jgi:NADPH:quinone reductase-like Zn-dependent oxidoreductase
VKSLGADSVFDYSTPNVGQQIRDYTKNQLYYAYDSISEHESPQICADALSSAQSFDGKKLQYCCILPAQLPREDVEQFFTLAYNAPGEEYTKFGRDWPAKPEEFDFIRKFIPTVERLLNERKLKPHKAEIRSGGLEGIIDGLEDYKNGKVSAAKLVYRI